MSVTATAKRRAPADPLAVLISRSPEELHDEPRRDWTRPTFAAAISLLAHGLLLAILAFQLVATRGASYAELVPIEANLDVPLNLFDNEVGEIETNPALTTATEKNDSSDAPAKLDTRSDDAPNLQGVTSTPVLDPAGKGVAAVNEGLNAGSGGGPAGDGAGRTELPGGLSAAGRRIVYCIDRSASMNKPVENPAMEWAKDELIRSIRKLSPNMSFQCVFYSDNVVELPNPDRRKSLIPATDQNKERAIQFIRDLEATGGTKHDLGLERTFELNPDVIFFMTDAEDDDDDYLRRLTNRFTTLNRRKSEQKAPASIHMIQLWHKPGTPTDVIRDLPLKNNGSYKLILAKDLGKRIVP